MTSQVEASSVQKISGMFSHLTEYVLVIRAGIHPGRLRKCFFTLRVLVGLSLPVGD